MEDFKIFFISFLEKSPPTKKEFTKKPSSISLDLILQQDSMAINVPVVEIPSVPAEKSVENDVLLKQSSQEKPKVDIDLHDKPIEEESKEKVKEEEKVPEPVAEPEPKFSKINIGDEPKKSASTMSKQVNNTAKKESKIVEHHEHFRDDDKRVSSAGSSSSSSSGAELYV